MAQTSQIYGLKGKLVTKPGQLPFGVAAGGEGDRVDARLKLHPALQMGVYLPEANGHTGGGADLAEALNLLDHATPEHRPDVAGDAFLQFRTLAGEEQAAKGKKRITFPLAALRLGRRAGQEKDLKSAQNTAGILKVDMGASGGIDLLETPLEILQGQGGEFGAKGRIGVGRIHQAVSERLHVQAGTADDDGHASAGGNLGHFLPGQGDKTRGVKGLGRREDADEMMRGASQEVGAGLGGQDAEAGIDLIGIGTNNFAAEPASQFGGESAFADPGGAGNNDGCITAQAAARTAPLRTEAARPGGSARCASLPRPWRH